MIEKAPFGRTGHLSTRTVFGAAALGSVKQAQADHTLGVLLHYGVNHVDTALALLTFTGLISSTLFPSRTSRFRSPV